MTRTAQQAYQKNTKRWLHRSGERFHSSELQLETGGRGRRRESRRQALGAIHILLRAQAAMSTHLMKCADCDDGTATVLGLTGAAAPPRAGADTRGAGRGRTRTTCEFSFR